MRHRKIFCPIINANVGIFSFWGLEFRGPLENHLETFFPEAKGMELGSIWANLEFGVTLSLFPKEPDLHSSSSIDF